MNLRTPLGQVRGLGSAKEGTAHWWAQRLTALALIPLVVWFVLSVIVMLGAEHAAMVAWIKNPLVAIFLLLLILAGFQHAQLGMQVVIEDYVHTEWVKIAAVVAVKFAAIALGVATAFSVLKIAFGA